MKYKPYFLLIIFFCFSCKRDSITPEKIITLLKLTPENPTANGSSELEVRCEINSDASTGNREVVLRTNIGQFADNKEKKLVKKAEFEDNKLVIRTNIVVPQVPGSLTVSAEPNLSELIDDFIVTKTVTILPSLAATVDAIPSSFYIWNSDFKREVTIIGLVKNENGGKVSNGVKAKIEDFLPSGAPAGGRFREEVLNTGADSKVSAIYSPAENLPVGSEIILKVTILNETGQPSNISDSVIVTLKS